MCRAMKSGVVRRGSSTVTCAMGRRAIVLKNIVTPCLRNKTVLYQVLYKQVPVQVPVLCINYHIGTHQLHCTK